MAFCSLSVPGGDINSNDQEFMLREDANFAWLHASYQFYRNTVDVLFILVNDALPGTNVVNRLFYELLLDKIKNDYTDMNFIIVHRNTGGDTIHWIRNEYDNIPNLSVLSVLGPVWPPLQVTIETNGNGIMPSITIDGENWFYDLWGIEHAVV